MDSLLIVAGGIVFALIIGAGMALAAERERVRILDLLAIQCYTFSELQSAVPDINPGRLGDHLSRLSRDGSVELAYNDDHEEIWQLTKAGRDELLSKGQFA